MPASRRSTLCCPVGCGGTDEATLPSKGSVKATGEAQVDPPALREVLGWPEDDQTFSKTVETLLKEKKVSAALEEMKRIRDGYDEAGDGARYVRASIEILKLEYALGKPETMIEQANRIRLPKDLLGHTVLIVSSPCVSRVPADVFLGDSSAHAHRVGDPEDRKTDDGR